MPLSIYTILKGEHEEVNALFLLLEAAPNALDGERESIFNQLRSELLSHARAERIAVYERLAGRLADQSPVEKAEDQHDEIERLVESEWHGEFQTDAWKEQVEVLKERVRLHVEEEEGELFELMRRVFTDEETDKMVKEFQELKEKEKERLEKSVADRFFTLE